MTIGDTGGFIDATVDGGEIREIVVTQCGSADTVIRIKNVPNADEAENERLNHIIELHRKERDEAREELNKTGNLSEALTAARRERNAAYEELRQRKNQYDLLKASIKKLAEIA